MKLIKKDWLYDVNIFMYSMIVGALGLGIAFLFFLNATPDIVETIHILYGKVYNVLAMIIFMYPFFVFKAICPQLGDDKVYLSTANLPYSKKEIFYKSLSRWKIIYPLFIILTTIILCILNPSTESFTGLFILELGKPLIVLFVGTLIQFQLFSGIIFTLSREYKWQKVLSGYILSNTILFSIFGLFMNLANGNSQVEYKILGIAGVIYFIIALSIFLISWRDVEYIWQ